MTPQVLDQLGRRIMICGPSNAGKSTLSVALGAKLGIPVVHLDQLRFRPNTDWVRRPDSEFESLHADAIAGDAWVMEGNYSPLMPTRLARATGIILLTDNRWVALFRYFRRTLFQRARIGNVAGERDSIKWLMIRWIVVIEPANQVRYRRELPEAGLPFLEVKGRRELEALYRAWGLQMPTGRGAPLPVQ